MPLHAVLNLESESKQIQIVEILLSFGADSRLPRGKVIRQETKKDVSILSKKHSNHKDLQSMGISDTPFNLCKNETIKKMFNSPKYQRVVKKSVLEWIKDQSKLSELYDLITKSGFDLGYLKILFARYENLYNHYNTHYASKQTFDKKQAEADTEYLVQLATKFRQTKVSEEMLKIANISENSGSNSGSSSFRKERSNSVSSQKDSTEKKKKKSSSKSFKSIFR